MILDFIVSVIKLFMSNEQEFSTPMRGVDDKEAAETGIKVEKEESSVQEREEEEHPGAELD